MNARTLSESLRALQVNEGSQAALPCSARPPTLQLKLAFVIERIDDQPQLFGISSDAQSDRLRLFLRLGRCLLWLLRCWRWTLFKDNLSFPGNVRADDLLSKLLQIEFDIRDSLFRFCVRLAYVRSYLNCFTVGKWIRFLRNLLSRGHSTRAPWHDRAR